MGRGRAKACVRLSVGRGNTRVRVRVWEERACFVLASAIESDKQFLWSPAGASPAAPPLRQDEGSGVHFFLCLSQNSSPPYIHK